MRNDNQYRGPRIIAPAGNRGHLWGEQHRIETRTKRNHSWVNLGCLTIGGNYSRSPVVFIEIQFGFRRSRPYDARARDYGRLVSVNQNEVGPDVAIAVIT